MGSRGNPKRIKDDAKCTKDADAGCTIQHKDKLRGPMAKSSSIH